MAFSPEQLKAHREKLKAAGICTACHKRKPSAGFLVCDTCRATRKGYKDALVERGVCRDCAGPLDDPTKRKCVNCQTASVENNYWRRQRI